MSIFKKLKEILITPPEYKMMAELYGNVNYYNLLVKLHNMRIAQLGEEIMGANTMTSEGQIKVHGLQKKVEENEHYLAMFEKARQDIEKKLKAESKKVFRQQRFKPINKLQDL